MRACWLKWVGRDWSISADYIWLNYSGANIGALPNGVTDQLHQIGIALRGLSGSRQQIVLYGQTSRYKAIAHRERYLHLVDRRQIFGEGTTQECKCLAVNKIHNAGG